MAALVLNGLNDETICSILSDELRLLKLILLSLWLSGRGPVCSTGGPVFDSIKKTFKKNKKNIRDFGLFAASSEVITKLFSTIL